MTVLTAHQGNTEAAFQELNKVQLKPFLMRIWGQGDSGEVTSGQQQPLLHSHSPGPIILSFSLVIVQVSSNAAMLLLSDLQ